MKHRKITAAAAAAVLAVSLCACSSDGGAASGSIESGSSVPTVSASSAGSQGHGSYEITLPGDDSVTSAYTSVDDLSVEPGATVAVVAKELNLEYWKAVKDGAQQAVDEINEENGFEKDERVTLTFDGTKDSTDVDGQINAIDSVLSENPTALCIAAIDMDSCKTQLEAAKENSIPVITLDSGIESDLVTANCTTDNVAAGREAMNNMCQSISDVGKIAIVTHAQSQKSAVERNQGFAEEITNHPKVEVAARLEENDEESVETMLKATLEVTPELDGVICTNEGTTEQVLKALSKFGRSDIRVVGFDLGKAQVSAIREGREYGTVAENPRGMGCAAVVAALRAASGETVEKQIDTGYRWIDKDTIDLKQNEAYLY
ncbi:MAG: substrate-binding domain-containing protein [Lachnospiraceae bacterium]|nr:substrate-binding domain-containing protein [Lachnospiraceae bacterium]MCI1328749.1 substrate-binding domain-containing protein [Lachnospiraceae bacterium]